MNKTYLYYLLGAGALYFGYRYFGKAKAAQTLNVKLKTLNLSDLTRASVVLDIINPNNAAININSIVADLNVNDFALSTLSFQGARTIPANNSISLELMIKINPLDTALFLANMLKAKKVNSVAIKGTISGEGISVPISIVQNLK
jgi:LEA14-like dessication related protein